MPDLSTYLSLSDLQPFFEDACATERIDEEWRRRYSQRLESIVHPRLGAFFKALKAEGRLNPIPNSGGYSCRRWNAWNAVAALKDDMPLETWDTTLRNLADLFAHDFTFGITYPYTKVLREQGLEAARAFDKAHAFNEHVSRFNAGDFQNYHFSHESCWETGLSLTLRFTNWVPEGCYISKNGVLPVPPLGDAGIQETTITLRTGNLLALDWFRIEEFTDAVDNPKFQFDIDARTGRENQARFYAEKFGFISVSLGSGGARVFQDGNTLVIGHHTEGAGPAPAHLTDVGSVCTELWATTLIEYERLVEIVSQKLPITAKEVVDSYLASLTPGSYGLLKVKVEPGTYYLYHYGHHTLFAEKAKAAGMSMDRYIDEPYFILSKDRLLS